MNVNANLTKEMVEILEHTKYRAAKRHYCGDSEAMQALVKEGLMIEIGRVSFVPDPYFTITIKGELVLDKLGAEGE